MLTMQKQLTYKVVEKEILRRIMEGVYATGSQLPTERELEKELEVSRLTIAKGLANLAASGYITRTQGRGTFVCDRLPTSRTNNIIRRSAGKGIVKYISPLSPMGPSIISHGVLEGVHDVVLPGDSNVGVEFYSSAEQQLSLLSSYTDPGNDGFVIWPGSDARLLPVLRRMKKDNFPFALIDIFFPELNCDYIISDNSIGAESMINHLVKCGHNKICYFTTPPNCVSLSERLSGVISGLSKNGLPLNGNTINVIENQEQINVGYFSDYATEILEEKLRRIMNSPSAPSAIFASNDYLAIPIYNLLEKMKIRVPDDVSLAGFDNIDASQYFKVPLTTVAQDFYEIGRMAGKVVIARRDGSVADGMLFQNRVAPELVVRQSVKNIV